MDKYKVIGELKEELGESWHVEEEPGVDINGNSGPIEPGAKWDIIVSDGLEKVYVSWKENHFHVTLHDDHNRARTDTTDSIDGVVSMCAEFFRSVEV